MSVFQVIALVSAALAVLAALWDAFRRRRDDRYSSVVLLIAAFGPVLSLVVYLAVTGLALKQVVTIAMLAVGAILGVLVARRARLTRRAPAPIAPAPPGAPAPVAPRQEVALAGVSWLPVPAALAVATVQLAVVADSFAAQVISLAALEAAVAFGVGAALTLIARRQGIRRPPAVMAPPMPGWPPPQR
jgi:hypothetical protein